MDIDDVVFVYALLILLPVLASILLLAFGFATVFVQDWVEARRDKRDFGP